MKKHKPSAKGMKLTPEDMRLNIPENAGKRFHTGFERGQLQVELYSPKKEDRQKPHDRDECYVITRGTGKFIMGDEETDFKTGDFLFVPAGMPHKFVDFGDEMETWVIFYGPEGGEDVTETDGNR
ncbi:MAG: cupin domain-containing protein [Parvularculales bacterium]